MAATELKSKGWSTRTSLQYSGATRTALYYEKTPRKVLPDRQTVMHVERIGKQRPTYGTRRMVAQIRRQTGVPTNRKRIQQIYRKIGWITPKKTKNDIIRAGKRGRFKPTGPNQLWETDITYVWCGVDGWCYCFNVIDTFTRKWITYVFDTQATAQVAVESLTKAVSTISADEARGLLVRSDNGVQYTSREFKESMKALGVRCEYIWHNTPEQNGHVESFHKTCGQGSPRQEWWIEQNGHVESFHKTLKKEYVWPHDFARFQDAEAVLAEAFADYNQDRIHSALGYLTPDEFVRKTQKRQEEVPQK